VTQRDRYLLIGAAALAVVGGFWLLLLHPKVNDLDKAKTELATAQAGYQSARQNAQQYAKARAEFPSTYASMARLGKAVPANTDQASLVYQLDQAAENAGVAFQTLSLSAASPGGAAPEAAAPVATTSPEDSVLGSVPADATLTAAAPTGTAAGAAELRVMHYDLAFRGGFFKLEHLIRNVKRLTWSRENTLQIGGRLLSVDSVTFDSNGSKVVMAVTAYLTPKGQGLFGGATPQGPAPVTPSTQTASAPGANASAPPAATIAP
jgi:hypothetical protein